MFHCLQIFNSKLKSRHFLLKGHTFSSHRINTWVLWRAPKDTILFVSWPLLITSLILLLAQIISTTGISTHTISRSLYLIFILPKKKKIPFFLHGLLIWSWLSWQTFTFYCVDSTYTDISLLLVVNVLHLNIVCVHWVFVDHHYILELRIVSVKKQGLNQYMMNKWICNLEKCIFIISVSQIRNKHWVNK